MPCHVVHVTVVAVFEPAQQVLLILREVQFGDAQGIKTQFPGQGCKLAADGRQVEGCKVGRAGHGSPV
jgi:hypothetical protein